MSVHVEWQVERRLVADERVRAAVEAALAHGGRSGTDVGVVFVDERTSGELHGRWLGDPTPTDVISFDLDDDLGGDAGELYVSVDQAVKVARERGIDPGAELVLYVVHGTLHLCGYDDHEDDDRRAMRVAEREVLSSLGLPPPAVDP